MSIFSVFGVLIIVLGVVFLSHQTMTQQTQTDSQAYNAPSATTRDRTDDRVPRPDIIHSGTLTGGTSRPPENAKNPSTSESNKPDSDTAKAIITESPVFKDIGSSEVGKSNGSSSNNNDSKDKKDSSKEKQFTAQPMNCSEYIVLQTYFRDNQGYYRAVPIDGNGQVQWQAAGSFTHNLDLYKNSNFYPGQGQIQAEHADINPLTSRFLHAVYRDGKSYCKNFITDKGKIDWDIEAKTPWTECLWHEADDNDLFTDPIQPGEIFTAIDRYNIVDKKEGKLVYFEDLHLSGKAYRSTYTRWYKDGKEVKSTLPDSPFAFLLNLRERTDAIPGSGDITASAAFVSPQQNRFYQRWVRGNVLYSREAPIYNGTIDFSKATPIKVELDLNANPSALPGKGEVQAMTNVVTCK